MKKSWPWPGLEQHIVEIYFGGNQERMDRFLMSAEFNEKIDAIVEKHFSSGNVSVGEAAIEHRFGFHKATIEGANATAPKHAALRVAFRIFAHVLDGILPGGRAKALVFTELETASMWAHKAIAETAPIANDPVPHTQEENIQFRKDWDRRVDEAANPASDDYSVDRDDGLVE